MSSALLLESWSYWKRCSRWGLQGALQRGLQGEPLENPWWCEFQWQQHDNVYWIGFPCGNCVGICVPMILWNCKRPRCLGSKAWKNISKDKPWQAMTYKPWQAHPCLRSNWRPLWTFVDISSDGFWCRQPPVLIPSGMRSSVWQMSESWTPSLVCRWSPWRGRKLIMRVTGCSNMWHEKLLLSFSLYIYIYNIIYIYMIYI